MSIPDEKINMVPEFLKEMCGELSDQEQVEAYERLLEYMKISWRIHVRLMSEEDALTEIESPIVSNDKKSGDYKEV